MKYVSFKSLMRKLKVLLFLLLNAFSVMAQNQTVQQDTVLSLGTEVMMLTKGLNVALPYSIDGADSLVVLWTTSDDSVASVIGDGIISAVNDGRCTITASYCTGKQAQCLIIVGNETNSSDGLEYVDLGLPSGTLWATANIGADSPEESGQFFQWIGDSIPEIANAKYGLFWRMPSISQFEELVDSTYTVCDMTSLNGVKGILVTGRLNGNSMFLPAFSLYDDSTRIDSLGNVCYWSSTLSGSTQSAYGLCVSSLETNLFDTLYCYYKLPVRLVYEGKRSNAGIMVSPTQIDFGSVVIGESRTLYFDIVNNTFENKEILPFNIDNEEFTVGWAGGIITPNSSQRVSVTYTPTKLSFATGSSFSICTSVDSSFVNVIASSRKKGSELSIRQNLVVWLNDGTKATFILNDEPVVTIDNGILKIDSKVINVEYSYKDVRKMTYEGDLTSVDNMFTDSENPFTITQESLSFFSDTENLQVSIVTTTGITIREFTAPRGETISLHLNLLNAGVYVIRVNDVSYKILIR